MGLTQYLNGDLFRNGKNETLKNYVKPFALEQMISAPLIVCSENIAKNLEKEADIEAGVALLGFEQRPGELKFHAEYLRNKICLRQKVHKNTSFDDYDLVMGALQHALYADSGDCLKPTAFQKFITETGDKLSSVPMTYVFQFPFDVFSIYRAIEKKSPGSLLYSPTTKIKVMLDFEDLQLQKKLDHSKRMSDMARKAKERQ